MLVCVGVGGVGSSDVDGGEQVESLARVARGVDTSRSKGEVPRRRAFTARVPRRGVPDTQAHDCGFPSADDA